MRPGNCSRLPAALSLLLVLSLGVPIAQEELAQERTGTSPREDVEHGDDWVPRPPPPRLFVVNATLSDNGDDDGWADTNETVGMRITVYNRMEADLTGVVARLSTDDPKIACISDAVVSIGSLAAGEMRRPPDRFHFTVADTNRTSPAEDFSVTFTVSLTADAYGALPDQQITMDLDLDATGGSGPTTYFESFENGFGTFTPMHLDADLNPPNSDFLNLEAGLQNADGYRCTYNNPDWEYSISYGTQVSAPNCFPNPSGWPDAYWFHVTDNRAFHGDASLHWGEYLNSFLGFTTPHSQLEAIRTHEPINLGWDRECSLSGVPCEGFADCQFGETCDRVAPELRFKHQISLVDRRLVGSYTSGERAVVHGQLADDAGAPLGHWVKIYPYVNVYDTQANSNFYSCNFDPIDDGNDEDDFFDPTDPYRFFGPSSTCAPERSFVHQGGTEDGFLDTNIGDAPDGPGLQGSAGEGTWVESRIDLKRYRGRRMRVRFLVSNRKQSGSADTWENTYRVNPDSADDGWFIDNVTLSHSLVSPATVTVDTRANIEIKEDFDVDDVPGVCDCAPDDGTAWELPGEVAGLALHSVLDPPSSMTMLTWESLAEPGGTVHQYEVLSSSQPGDFVAGLGCILAGSESEAFDATDPAPGETEFFLVRARNACGSGTAGYDSSSVPRSALDCP